MSTAMIDCPLCERRVFANNGICPGCNADLSNEASVQRHILKRKASSIAVAARAQGASFGEIEAQLRAGGVDEGTVKEILIEVEGKTPEAMVERNDSDMRHGFYWLLGGILVTIVTYLIARSSESGGVYVIAYGAVVTGGIQFVRALLKSKERR